MVCQSPYPITLPCPWQVFPTPFSLHRYMSSTCTPMQMSRSASQTSRITFILDETVFFRLLDRCSCQRLDMFRKTEHGLAYSPHHMSAVLQQFGTPPFRWLYIQLFSFADFSVEESLCVVCHKSFVSKSRCRDILPRAYGCPELLLLLQSNLRHSEVLRNLSQCTWISKLLEFSSRHPTTRHDA